MRKFSFGASLLIVLTVTFHFDCGLCYIYFNYYCFIGTFYRQQSRRIYLDLSLPDSNVMREQPPAVSVKNKIAIVLALGEIFFITTSEEVSTRKKY